MNGKNIQIGIIYSINKSQKFTKDDGTINNTHGIKKQYVHAQYLLLINVKLKIITTKYISIGKPIKTGMKLKAALIINDNAKNIPIKHM